jgi:NADPH-dependent glutamate synthase beta subunit-like oxidoreductase/NAD(P)H-flavin reductase
MNNKNFLNPKYHLNFQDLYQLEGIKKINQYFNNFLQQKDQNIYQQFSTENNYNSQFLTEVAKYLEMFLVDLFLIDQENIELQKLHQNYDLIFQARRDYVQRVIAKQYPLTKIISENLVDQSGNLMIDQKIIDGKKILFELSIEILSIEKIEYQLAKLILENSDNKLIELYAIWALYSRNGKEFHRDGSLFILPKKVDKNNLLEITNFAENNFVSDQKKPVRGFDLCDQGYQLNRIHSETKYCIHCHLQEKDYCRKGYEDKNTKQIKIDQLNVKLSGCPLDQKISEMNLLKSQGFTLASLAVAVIDNPMIAGTGHRICNDCMKACIFQNQDSVDIPQIETRIVKDVLNLPYGFEIYSLLTRWNPLNQQMPMELPATGKKILVCGLGPAGYTLANYLLNYGHEVIAIDGLKIEPLPEHISGKNIQNQAVDFLPIKNFQEIYEPLATRQIAGFGGVAEYGITSRYDKNFLKVIRIILQRRANFKIYGGIRFGSSIDEDSAFNHYGFDHIALCIGAGKPQILDLKNNFVKGVRLASDFLMALQLNGAYQQNSLTNLQVSSPIIVIGGGLTAIDTATEVKAYYDVEVVKFKKYLDQNNQAEIFRNFNQEEIAIANKFIEDAKNIENTGKSQAEVKILYRKQINQSPAYRSNHQEIIEAKKQGIEFIDNCEITEIIIDQHQAIKAVKTNQGQILPCKTLLVAIGTTPNLSVVFEDHLNLANDGKYYLSLRQQIKNSKNFTQDSIANDQFANFKFINKVNQKNQAISFFGDLHQDYEGSVVKAMASAKDGVKEINEILKYTKNIATKRNYFQDFQVKIKAINRLSNHVVEVQVQSALLANATKVGQIFRLQNYQDIVINDDQSKLNLKINSNKKNISIEGIAITALNIDYDQGLITGIVVETGGSTSLIKNFKVNEPCVFMGPSGKPTYIPKNQTVVLIGGGRGNQVLTILAKAFKNNGCKVYFFAGYRNQDYIVNYQLMKENCDHLIIAIEEKELNQDINFIEKNNFQESFFHGNIIQAIENYFKKNHLAIDTIFAIGNDQLMHEIARLRHQKIVDQFAKAKYAIASLNAPMQCMMKGVCAQCLQKKVDKNGVEQYFYSCANQDQSMDEIDFNHLHHRCQQNSMLEKISKHQINNF